ncbi:hypothetical protein AI28_20920 [bacteria symbiont BFo1 of Frankliniella occidentalis]|nr:hypothetical protein AI28_20920 [bacteria symbiont BFo1 of Frankliniella occidentalis]
MNISAIKDIAVRRAGMTLTDMQAQTFGQLAKGYNISVYDLDSTIANRIGYSGEPARTGLKPLTAPVPTATATATTPDKPAVSSQTVNSIKNSSMTASILAGQQAAAAARAALQGAQLTAANQARAQMQINALLGAQLTQMNIDRVKTQVVGRPTFTETVPAVVLNKPVVKNSAPFQTAKGTGGSSKGQRSQHAGGSGHGENNAGSHAFGGHGYGANNTGSEGFGGGSQFH